MAFPDETRVDRLLPVFDGSQSIYVRKSFPLGGKLWTHGMLFPWKQLKVPERKIRQMYRLRILMLEAPKVPGASAAPAAPPAMPQEAAALPRQQSGTAPARSRRAG